MKLRLSWEILCFLNYIIPMMLRSPDEPTNLQTLFQKTGARVDKRDFMCKRKKEWWHCFRLSFTRCSSRYVSSGGNRRNMYNWLHSSWCFTQWCDQWTGKGTGNWYDGELSVLETSWNFSYLMSLEWALDLTNLKQKRFLNMCIDNFSLIESSIRKTWISDSQAVYVQFILQKH